MSAPPPSRADRALRGPRGHRTDSRRRRAAHARALSTLVIEPHRVRQIFNDTDRDALWLVVGVPPEAANTREMTPEQLAALYPDGPKALPPELADTAG